MYRINSFITRKVADHKVPGAATIPITIGTGSQV